MRATRTSVGVTATAMLLTPFAGRRGRTSDTLAAVVVAGLAATTVDRTVRRSGRPGRLIAGTVGLGWLAEWVGTRTGRPFGRYAYTARLRPTIGGVPVLVPLAWFAMAGPARETARAVLGDRSTTGARVLLGATALTAWDLFLDPQMVAADRWRWSSSGRYRGIPASNYVGWWLTSVAMMTVAEVLDPPGERPADPVLVGQYAGMAVMETVAFATFFRDRRVAVVGGLGMVPLALVAAVRARAEAGR